MKATPPDPLSNEERELATMLARMAPHGVPSPEIDARIVSASRAAVAGARTRPARPRWPMAMGVAASMVLAVGVAWQLRPTPPAAIGLEQAPVEFVPSAGAAAEPPLPVARAQPMPASVVADESLADDLPRSASNAAAPPTAAPALPPPTSRKPVPPAPQAEPAEPAEAEMLAPVAAPPAPPPAAPAPRSAPTAAPPALPAGSSQTRISGMTAAQRQEALRQAAANGARDADGAAEAAAASRRELRVAPISERLQDHASSGDGGSTRARRTDLRVPVAADAQLQVDDWLERVRTRYGLGDEEAARRSLMLFVQDHPGETVPGDLEPLLDQ